jgi:hypothetical protein
MIEAVLWMAGGSLLTIVALVCYAAYVGLMTSDEQYRRDVKHRNHHRWQG